MTTAIIQARMSSTRLPDKTLMDIEGRPMLWHLIERAKRARLIDRIVIATTYNPRDRAILDFARAYGIEAYQGDEDDVLDRIYKVAKKIKADPIVRITPDCPLNCPEVMNRVIAEYLKGGYDCATNTLLYTYPDGCDVEVFSFKALEKSWKECKDPSGREHVTSYIKHSGKFSVKNVESNNPVNPRDYKWSVDKAEDLKFVREVYRYLYKGGRIFSLKDIMSLIKGHPEIRRINSGMTINEGVYKSIVNSPLVKPKRPRIRKSLALKERAEKVIPDCTQTYSKGPNQFIQGVAPVFMERGKGSHVWDVDGNEFIDYTMALGSVILGYNYPAVTGAVKKVLEDGISFTLPHKLETELAELLCETIPCAEQVKFGKNGSDVTSAAVRAARAYTGRDKIACCGYHGWQDWYVATTTRNNGIPEAVKKLTLTFEYDNIASLEKLFRENKNEIACVIIEPTSTVEPKDNFLQEVARITRENGALLIYDEIVTGFRFSLGGAQEYFGVTPDMACFGKAMGNGFPISAVVGRKDIMKSFEEIFYSITFGGETASIVAAIATIKEIKSKDCILHIWELGRRIKEGYNVLAREYGLKRHTECLGYPPRTVIAFKDKRGRTDLLLKSLFQQECIKRGVLATGSHNICFSHSHKDIDYTLRVYNTVLKIMKDAVQNNKVKKLLRGKPVEPVFRMV